MKPLISKLIFKNLQIYCEVHNVSFKMENKVNWNLNLFQRFELFEIFELRELS